MDDGSAGTSLPSSLSACIAAPPRAHPRLFLSESEVISLRQRCSDDPVLQQVLTAIRTQAEADLHRPPIRYELTGRRLLDVSRTCLARVVRCAFLWRIDHDKRHLERAKLEMLAAASFCDWNPSHFLDTAEMTAALAIGYDWLFHDMDGSARLAIRAAIIYNGLMAFQGNTRSDNWNQVCNGGMTLGALAVIEDEPMLASRIINQAVADLPVALQAYEPDGVYPEGPMYWSYGTSYSLLMIAALESALGTNAGLTTHALTASADYYQHMIGPTGQFFNYGDCNARPEIEPALAWLARHSGNPSFAWSLRTTIIRGDLARIDRLLPFVLIWSPASSRHHPPESLHYVGHGPTPVAVHRSGWTADATWVAIKGGSASTNHAHMDAGTFVIDGDGVRWAGDLGMQDYHALESRGVSLWDMAQSSQRWAIFRLGPASHNIITVDSARQQVSGSGRITYHDQASTIVDLTSVYDRQLASVQRCIQLLPDRSVIILDKVTALAGRQVTIRWAMLSGADVAIVDPRRAVLTHAGHERHFRILSPADASVRIYASEPPPSDLDAANPGTRLVGFEATVPAGTTVTCMVQIAPPGAAIPPAAVSGC